MCRGGLLWYRDIVVFPCRVQERSEEVRSTLTTSLHSLVLSLFILDLLRSYHHSKFPLPPSTFLEGFLSFLTLSPPRLLPPLLLCPSSSSLLTPSPSRPLFFLPPLPHPLIPHPLTMHPPSSLPPQVRFYSLYSNLDNSQLMQTITLTSPVVKVNLHGNHLLLASRDCHMTIYSLNITVLPNQGIK